MKRISVLLNFKSAGQAYYAGEHRVVSDEDAHLFCKAGWARAEGIETGVPNTAPVTLEVQDVVSGHALEDIPHG